MGPRWRMLVVYVVASTGLLLVSSIFGPMGWAVPLVVLNPLLVAVLAWRDTARRGVTWWWFAVPALAGALQALVLMNASALPFVALLLVGAGIGTLGGRARN